MIPLRNSSFRPQTSFSKDRDAYKTAKREKQVNFRSFDRLTASDQTILLKKPVHQKTQKQILDQWAQKANRVNERIKIKRMLSPNREPFQFFSRCGGVKYQQKIKDEVQQNSKQTQIQRPFLIRNNTNASHAGFRITVDTREKSTTTNQPQKQLTQTNKTRYSKNSLEQQNQLKKHHRKMIKMTQTFRKIDGNSCGFNVFGLKSSKEVQFKKNVMYQAVVNRIGFNMQYQSKLRNQHLQDIFKIKVNKRSAQTSSYIIFSLKDTDYKPNQVGQMFQGIEPICIALYPQYFDNQQKTTIIKRQLYLDKLFYNMNGSYDPYLLSKIPKISSMPSFNAKKYFQLLPTYVKSIEEDYKRQWAEGIIDCINLPLTEQQIKSILRQVWDLFNKSNGMAIFDYSLKDPAQMKRLKVAPFLPTRLVTANDAIYHGGYSKSLYQPWNLNVTEMKAKLQKRIIKLNDITQKINQWNVIFNQLKFFDLQFFFLLGKPLSISFFSKVQLERLQQTFNIIKNVWFRGVFTILEKKRFLMVSDQSQFEFLNQLSAKFKQLMMQARSRTIANNIQKDQQVQSFYLKFFKNWLKSLHKNLNISSIKQLKSINVDQDQRPPKQNLLVLLKIQFSQSIRRSFNYLKSYIMNPRSMNKRQNQYMPIIKLHLVVDRQSLKFKESKQLIIENFKELIKKLFSLKMRGSELSYGFNHNELIERVDSGQIFEEYPQISLIQNDKPTLMALQFTSHFMHHEQINQIIQQLKKYYEQCHHIVQNFEPFLPFVKHLMPKQFCIEDSFITPQQSFQKDSQRLKIWKDKIKQMQIVYRSIFFEVNCTQAIKSIEQKINQIQYRIDQKYQKRIYDSMYQIQQKINEIKNQIFSKVAKPDNLQTLTLQLDNCLKTVKQLNRKVKQVAQKVLFFVSHQRKAGPLVNRFQLIAKSAKTLAQQVQSKRKQLNFTRPQLQDDLRQQGAKIVSRINAVCDEIKQSNEEFIDITYSDSYFLKMQNLSNKIKNLKGLVQIYNNNVQSLNIVNAFKSELSNFAIEADTFQNIMMFWSSINRFQIFIKEIMRMRVKDISADSYQTIILQSLEVLNSFRLQKQTNLIQQRYWKVFQTDITRYNKYYLYVKILCNKRIKERHWKVWQDHVDELRKQAQKNALQHKPVFATQNDQAQDIAKTLNCKMHIKDIIFKELARIQLSSFEDSILSDLSSRATLQYQIEEVYERIQKKLKTTTIKIIDINGADALSIEDTLVLNDQLYKYQLECEKLLQNQYSTFYKEGILQILQVIRISLEALNRWLQFEPDYIKFSNFYTFNEDGPNQQIFQKIKQLHRKIIKSFDFDSTIWCISKNVILSSNSIEIIQTLKLLKEKTSENLQNIRKSYPRLYLLSDNELFELMWNKDYVKINILKCFQKIEGVDIKEGWIQKVGSKNQLKLSQQIYFVDRLGNVHSWVKHFQEVMKKSMKQVFFKYMNQRQFYAIDPPMQLKILSEQIVYTRDIQDAICMNGIDNLIENNHKKIAQASKTVNKDSNIILIFIIYRQILNGLKKQNVIDVHEFQWQRYPRFYGNNSLSTHSATSFCKINIQIMKQRFQYNFSYLDQCQLILTDHVLLGNCFIGEQQTGKRSLLNFYAYITANQLITFSIEKQEKSGKNMTLQLVNYFKLAAFSGCWMSVNQFQHLKFDQMSVFAQCLLTIDKALLSKKSQISLLGENISFNLNTRFFMTASNLKLSKMPQRLCMAIRPNFVVKPDVHFLTQVYLQAHGIKDMKILKTIDFCNWIEHKTQIPLDLAQMIKKADSPMYFVKNQFYQDLKTFGYFNTKAQEILNKLTNSVLSEDSFECNFGLQNQKNKLILGKACSGKTTAIMKAISRFTFTHIDMAVLNLQDFQFFQLYVQKYKPQYILIENGIKFFYLFNDMIIRNPKTLLIFEQNNSSSTYGSLLNNMTTIYYQNKDLQSQIVGQQQYAAFNQKLSESYNSLIQLLEINQSSKQYCHIIFLKIFKEMLKRQFRDVVAFVFSFTWVYSQFIVDSMANFCLQILQQLNCFQNIYDVSQLQSLVPLSQKLSHQLLQSDNYSIQLWQNQQSIIIKSNILSNLSILRSLINDPICIQSRDWLTTMLKQSAALSKFKQSKYISPKRTFTFDMIKNRLIEKIPIVPTNRKYYYKHNVHVIIDDLHLAPKETQDYLGHFIRNNQLLYKKDGVMTLFGLQGGVYTLGYRKAPKRVSSHFDKSCLIRKQRLLVNKNEQLFLPDILHKILTISIHQKSHESIYQVFVAKMWSQYPDSLNEYNMSAFIKNIHANYQFFWIDRPIIKCHNPSKTANFKSYCSKVLSTISDMLPIEQRKKLSQSLARSHQSIEKMPNPSKNKLEEFQNPNALQKQQVDQLLYNILEQHSDHIQLAQFQQLQDIFVNKYIKNYAFKLLRNIISKHVIMLGQIFTLRQAILKLACELLGFPLLKYHSQIWQEVSNMKLHDENELKVVVLIRSIDLSSSSQGFKLLDQLETLIKFRELPPELIKLDAEKLLRRTIFVIQMDPKSEETQKYYENYNFLKSRFVSIYFEQQHNIGQFVQTQQCMNSQIKQSKKLDKYQEMLQGLNEWRCFKMVEHLLKQYNLDRDFLINFSTQFNKLKYEQICKFQFYRNIVENMVVNIDKLAEQELKIPQQIKQISKNLDTYQKQKERLKVQIEQLLQCQARMASQISQLQIQKKLSKQKEALVQQKYENLQTSLNIKFSKIEAKLQKVSVPELNKLKKATGQIEKVILDLLFFVLQDKNAHPSALQSLRKKDFAGLIFQSSLNDNLKQKCQVFKVMGPKKFQKLTITGKLIYEWLAYFEDSYEKIKEMRKIQKELINKRNESRQIQFKTQQVKRQIQKNQLNMAELNRLVTQYSSRYYQQSNVKKQLIIWEQRLGSVLSQIKSLNYIKIMSSHHSAYFRSLHHIIFSKILMTLRFNQMNQDQQIKHIIRLDQSNIFNDYQNLQNFRVKLNLKPLSYQHLSYVHNILNTPRNIIVLQDRNNVLLEVISDACIQQQYSVINQPLIPIENLQNMIMSRLKSYDKVLVIYNSTNGVNGGWKTLHRTIQACMLIMNSNIKLNINRKLIIILKKLDQMKIQSFQNILQARIIVSNQILQKDLVKIMGGNKMILNQANMTLTMEYNNSMKILSKQIDQLSKSSAEHSKGSSFETYQKIENNMQKLRQLNISIENYQGQVMVIEAVRRKLKEKIGKFKIVYKILKFWQQSQEMSIFEHSQYYNCFIQILKATKLENCKNIHSFIEFQNSNNSVTNQILKNKAIPRVNQQMVQKLFRAFMIDLGKKLQWNSQNQLVNFCLLTLVLVQCPNCSNLVQVLGRLFESFNNQILTIQKFCKILHEQNIAQGINTSKVNDYIGQEKKQNFKHNIDRFLTTDKNIKAISDKNLDEDNSKNPRTKIKIPQWLEYLIFYFFSKPGFKANIVHNSKNQIIEAIFSVKKHYQHVKDLQFTKKDKCLTLIQSPNRKLSSLIDNIRKKALSKNNQFQILYFNTKQLDSSFEVLKSLFQKKIWIFIPNIGRNNLKQDQSIIHKMLYQLEKFATEPNFRIFIVIDLRIQVPVKHKHYRIRSQQNLDFHKAVSYKINGLPQQRKEYAILISEIFIKKGKKLFNQSQYEYYFEKLVQYLQQDKFERKIGSIAMSLEGQQIRKLRQNTAIRIIEHFFKPLKIDYKDLIQQIKRQKTLIQNGIVFENTLKKTQSYFQNKEQIIYNQKKIKSKILQINPHFQPFFRCLVEQFNQLKCKPIYQLKKMLLKHRDLLMNTYNLIQQLANKNSISFDGLQIHNHHIFNSIVYAAAFQYLKQKKIGYQDQLIALSPQRKPETQFLLGKQLDQYMENSQKYSQVFDIVLQKQVKSCSELISNKQVQNLFAKYRVVLFPSVNGLLGKVQICLK